MANDTLSFAKTLEGIMKRIKNMLHAFKRLESSSEEYLYLANEYLDLSKDYKALRISYNNALADLGAERSQKERYRTAFLDRMNVPVIGKAWHGDRGYSKES
jgi:hypothetical protein